MNIDVKIIHVTNPIPDPNVAGKITLHLTIELEKDRFLKIPPAHRRAKLTESMREVFEAIRPKALDELLEQVKE